MTDERIQPVTHLFETDAGVGEWQVVRFDLTETISETYVGSLVIAQPIETGDDPEEFIGSTCAVTLTRGDAVERRQCGIVRRMQVVDTTTSEWVLVRLDLVPALALLAQRINSRIFQEMDVTEIAKAVLEEGLGDYNRSVNIDGLKRSDYPKREYTVQHRESDLELVSRLLEEEGIGYCFNHDGDAEELLLFDDNNSCAACSLIDGEEVPAAATSDGRVEALRTFAQASRLTTTSVVMRDFDWSQPPVDLTAESRGQDSQKLDREQYWVGSVSTIGGYAEPQYEEQDGQKQAELRQQASLAAGVTGSGAGNVIGMQPGSHFTLAGHPDPELDAQYLITRVEHSGRGELTRELGQDDDDSSEALYSNSFICIPFDTPYRPARRRPRSRVPGAHTATVVGPSGEEIYTDVHGRIKVQFHWDREGANDENSSCWVRVMQTWAGVGWGTLFIPRIGMEVIVHFLDGNPDHPLVTGCVYNGLNPPPHTLPDDKTKSTIFTNSSIGGGGHNELTFEDAAGSEQVYVQAQNNMDTLVKADQTLKVGGNRDGTIDGNESLTVTGNRDSDVSGSRTTHVAGAQDTTIDSGEERTVSSGQTVSISGGQTTTISGGQEASVDGGLTMTVNGGRTTTVTGGDQIIISSPLIVAVAGPLSVAAAAFNLNLAAAEVKRTLGVLGKITIGAKGEALAGSKQELCVPIKVEITNGHQGTAIAAAHSKTSAVKEKKGSDTLEERTAGFSFGCTTPAGSLTINGGSAKAKAGGTSIKWGPANIDMKGPEVSLKAGARAVLGGSTLHLDSGSVKVPKMGNCKNIKWI